MSATQMNTHSRKKLAETLRKGFATEINRRSLSRVSGLRVDQHMPDHFDALLYELERAERQTSHGR